MNNLDPLKNISPLFPWFGGKRKVASLIWQGLGTNVDLYVEPFAGAAAVFLARPFIPRSGYEVINDADGFVVNAYRAVRGDPETVLRYVDDLRSELEMLSRHRWLRGLREDLWARLMEDPEFFDAKVAGMWIFGQCNGVQGSWLAYESDAKCMRPNFSNKRGIAASCLDLKEYVNRLSRTVILCGDYKRAISESYIAFCKGNVGVFLDPPYAFGERTVGCYGVETDISRECRIWAIEHGKDLNNRIVLAGYAGEHDMPNSWTVFEWEAAGTASAVMSSDCDRRGKANAARERLWFSPGCNRVEGAK